MRDYHAASNPQDRLHLMWQVSKHILQFARQEAPGSSSFPSWLMPADMQMDKIIRELRIEALRFYKGADDANT